MFSRSYAPSHVLEEAANNAASDSLQHLSARTPPTALAAPIVVNDLFTDVRTAEVVVEKDIAGHEEAPIASTSAVPLPGKRNARTSILGRALFPPSVNLSSNNNKRLSLPNGPLKKASAIPTLRRKSLSPSSSNARAATLHAASSGTLLAVPLAAQLHTLKARNASLESSLASVNATQSNGLFKATNRIASLEKELASKDKLQLECEGWEAEATRLAAELEGQQERIEEAVRAECERAQAAERALELEKSKKKRYKDLGAKLRCELLNRKWKEKWELCIMDGADRDRDANEVKLEAEIAMLRLQLGIARLDKEELEELNAHQMTRLGELSHSRELLLASYKGAESTIAALRAELSVMHKDGSKESTTLKKELSSTKSSLKIVQTELEAAKERTVELEAEAEEARNELARLEKGEKKSEAKEAADAKRVLEKEKVKREKAEAEVKELKASLKQSQVELREANKAAAATAKSVESKVAALAKVKAPTTGTSKASKSTSKTADPLPSVAALASRKRRSLTQDGSDPIPALGEEEEESAGAEDEDTAEMQMEDHTVVAEDTSIEELKAAAKSWSKKVKTPVVAPPSPVSVSDVEEEEEEEEESYRPPALKATSRVAPKAKAATAPILADADAEESASPAPKKRKAGVLADKPANATKKPKVVKAEKEKVVAAEGGKKKKAAGAIVEQEPAVEEDEPIKKKKRTLFGGPKKFAWNSIENADVNSLGLPSHLSPIKAPAAGRPTSLGVLGRGLNGRASIFG